MMIAAKYPAWPIDSGAWFWNEDLIKKEAY